MNTPAHMILGMAAFGKRDRTGVTMAAAAGGFAPDLSLFVMVGVSVYVLGIDPRQVFGQLFYSEEWQRVFAIDNSFFLWGLVLAAGWWWRRAALSAFAASGLLHVVFDFLLHNGDARMHFWPLSTWKFASPVSYWDSRFFGDIVGPLELIGALALCVWMLWRFRGWVLRGLVVVLGAAEVASSHIWHQLF